MNADTEGWILDKSVGPNAHLNQGDLISFEKEDNPLKKSGIVVTADCDLKNRKHAKLVTLVPVVSVDTILERYLLLEDCEKKKDLIENYVYKTLHINPSQGQGEKEALLIDQLKQNSLEEPLVFAIKVILDRIESVPISSYKLLMGVVEKPKKSDSLANQISSRGDLFLLPDPSGLGVKGNIAWVRHIWQVQLTDIAMRTSEASDKPGERIARLDSPYRYRLTQLMAQVFSDIGLPDVNHSIKQSIEDVYGNV